jgi:hypothetical protein
MALLRRTLPLHATILVLWASLVSVQSCYALADPRVQSFLVYANMFGVMAGIELNVVFARILLRALSPSRLLWLCALAMPTGALAVAGYCFAFFPLPDEAAVSVVFASSFVGGVCWMTAYSLCAQSLSPGLRGDATRLLNVTTMVGVLVGVGLGGVMLG